MPKSEPYYTLWELIEKWSTEMNISQMDLLKRIRRACTFSEPPTIHALPRVIDEACTEEPEPDSLLAQFIDERNFPTGDVPQLPLRILPVAFFSPHGELSPTAIHKALETVKHIDEEGQVSYRCRLYSTPEFMAAVEFLNSATFPPQPTDEMKKSLSQFGVLQQDLKAWCDKEKHQLPAFWFHPTKGSPPQQRKDLLSDEIDHASSELGVNATPAEIMKKLKSYAGAEGSCIIAATSEGVAWTDSAGKKKQLDKENLRKRLSRKRKNGR